MPAHQLKTNIIYCGDNLQMLKEIPDESVDLIYIDPPFNSNRNYEVFWGDIEEKRAFEDRFGDAEAYIQYMRPRILELYRVLKKTGSFYYHCDWHASHYVKVMLDQIFNFNNFLNEIIWRYRTGGVSKKHFARKHDTIFLYAKEAGRHTFNPLMEKSYLQKKYSYQEKYPEYWDEERKMWYHLTYMRDVWVDIEAIGTEGRKKRRRGYPTEKPVPLLERIIEASCNKGDVVLDAFCGCGTTLIAAEKMKRRWIGIDISPTACREMAQRLWDIFKLAENKDFIVSDLPKTEEELMKLPHFEFQNWACVALGAIPNQIKVGDYGIDGRLYPIEHEKVKQEGKNLFGDIDTYYPVQVKQKEKAGRPDIDTFVAAMHRDKRRKGYFVSFGFTEDANREIKRLYKKGELEIIPITVKDLLQQETLAQ